MNNFFLRITDWIAFLISPLEWLMLFMVIGGGLILMIQSRGRPFLFLPKAFQLLFKKEDRKGISRFQALSAVLAATVGLGNISGVAIAIHMGGPGILVWMWLTAFVGMIIKFYSCSLAVTLRQYDASGQPIGGPMYYMTIGLRKWGKPLAIWFSIAGLIGVLPAFTANQLTESIITMLPFDEFLAFDSFQIRFIFGLFLASLSFSYVFLSFS